MRIDILTLFPQAVSASLDISILGRAEKKGILDIRTVQIRDYTDNKQQQVDDYPYGGGWGCVMMAQPLKACLDDVMSTAQGRRSRVIYMSPQGRPFNQTEARRLVRDYDHLVLVCGHYEGIDERFITECCDEEISLGDFVLTGGEIAAMAVTDAVCRMVPGVLSDTECYTGESHWDGLLEYPQYTRPETWEGVTVPEVLRSGNQKEIDRWRRKKMLERTMDKRPDLWARFTPEGEDAKLAAEIELERNPPAPEPVFDLRTAESGDMDELTEIIRDARAYLASQGIDQWQGVYPDREDLAPDIERGEGWVFTCEGRIAGYLCIMRAPVNEYEDIEGEWPGGEAPYVSVHRMMVRGEYRGTKLASEMLGLAEDLAMGWGCGSVRLDTHPGNEPMKGLLRKRGYSECGTIRLRGTSEDGHLRVAEEKLL